jgi:eukaryotic-like serine/threonine-protein kinase
MTPERWQKIDDLFHAVLACDPAERSDFLRNQCAGDEPLRHEIESLLSSHEQTDLFIETPAGDVAAELLHKNKAVFEAGAQIENYRMIRHLGSGGMGEVYLAEDIRLKRHVALKLLPTHFTLNPDRVRRFEREARAASALNHPNIVTIYEFGRSNSAPFIASEFVDGKTLRQLINEKPFTLNETLNVSLQVADALSGAHAAGIVHRDIKPENIMIRRDGYVKILDFGLAKLTERADSGMETPTLLQSYPGLVMGTVQYMSPEQARGNKIDGRTDIWSLGVVLYELLSGHVPFSGETPSHVMVSVMEDQIPPLGDVGKMPAELSRIVTKSLRKIKKERYQTARELAHDLKKLKQDLQLEGRLKGSLEGVPGSKARTTATGAQASSLAMAIATETVALQSHPTSSAEYLVSEIKRHKRSVAITAAAAVIVLAAVAYFYFNRNHSRIPGDEAIDSIAVLPLVNSNPNSEYLSEGISESIINSVSRFPKLRVMPLNAVQRYKGQPVDAQEVGKALNVRAVLIGRLEQRGDEMTISAELVDARDNHRVWGGSYTRKATDMANIQADISRQIVDKLRLHLSANEQRQLSSHETADPRAYDLLLKSRYLWREGGTENCKAGIDLIQQAIVVDPTYALAYADLSGAYINLVNNNVLDQKEYIPRAAAAALKALELNNNLAEAHLAMANVRTHSWDWAAAEQEFKRAIELNPNLSGAHLGYAFFLIIHRRGEEALIEANRARDLDPVSTGPNAVVVFALIMSGHYDQALTGAKRILELDPGPFAQTVLGMTYEDRGQYPESLVAFQEAIRLGDQSPDAQLSLGTAYAKVGQPEKTRAILKQLKRAKEVSPTALAVLHVALREDQKAFELLEQAYAAHDQQLIWIGIESMGEGSFARIASDPRFVDLLQRINLTPPL